MDKSDTICRVCMDDDGENFISVFSVAAGCKLTAAVMIIDCTGVEVAEGDGMPEMICSECLNAIREANKIRSKCRNTDRKLRKILNLGTVKPKDKEALEQINTQEIATQTDEIVQPETQPPFGEQAVIILPEVFDEPSSPIEEPSQDIPVLVESPQIDVVEPEPEPVALIKQEQNPSVTPAYDTEYLVEEMKDCTGEDPTVESVPDSDEPAVVKQCEIISDDGKNDKHCIKIEVETLDELEYENYEAIDDDEETLQSEEPSGAPNSDEIVSCCGCPCEFKSMTELRTHSEQIHFPVNDSHSGILENSTCEICYKDHTSLKALAHHKANRHNRRQRMCGVCQLVLQSVRKKKQHEISHKSLPEGFHIKCCGCDHPIPFNQYGLHLEQVHKHGTEFSSKYVCEMCFTDCGSKQLLESHQNKSEAFNQQRKLVKPAQYDDKLDIVFSDTDGRQRFVCDICEKNFSTKGNLKSHRTLHDSSQKPIFKCTLCNPVRDFSKKSNYNVHMLRAHSSESLCCPDCGKGFKCSINLKTHMRVHTKERPYICGYCQKTFAHLSDKRRHEISHTHNYPFKCERCNKPFTRKTVLDRHLESCGHRMNRLQHFGLLKSPVRQQEDPIDFMLPGQFPDKSVMLPCDLCEQWFTTVEQLADHHAQMHIQTLDEGTYETEVEIE